MIGLLLAGFTPLAAQITPGPDGPLMTTLRELRAKAVPDECYRGLGLNKPFLAPPCSEGTPKVNQAYVWAIAEAGSDVWFGTFANGNCVTAGTLAPDPQNIVPRQFPSYVCEFGVGPFSPSPLPPPVGDFRPPQIFVYNKLTNTHVNVTPTVPGNPLQPILLVQQTLGMRAAARFGNLVILGGPSLRGGINLFAFRSDDRRFIAARNFPEFNEIRQWLLSDNNLYAAVGKSGGGGAILNWKGTAENPFQFEVVGNTDGFGAYLTKHEGRIFVITWPPYRGTGEVISSLYMSPPVPEGGLTPADAHSWTKVWQASDYEPDPLVASRYAGGALASFDGFLYWGTMHIPFDATGAFFSVYGFPENHEDQLAAVIGTFRTTSIFRGRNFGENPKIDLLYGRRRLPAYMPPTETTPGEWQLVSNNMGKAPRFGPSGFGNPFNNYTWSMAVWDDRLWVGTMDWSYLAYEGAANADIELPPALFSRRTFGADLFYFPSSSSPAIAETLSGAGNYTSYGVRNILSSDNLFLGMANPMNLLTDTTDDLPEGGWELLELSRRTENTPQGSNVEVDLGNNATITFRRVRRAGFTAGVITPTPFRSAASSLARIHPLWENFELDNPVTPFGGGAPQGLFLISSSADWRSGGGNRMLAEVCVPADNGSNAGLFQLQFDSKRGYSWKDVTTRVSDAKVCGGLNKKFLGVLAVMERGQ
ncbi:MAG: hypothetical protein LC776_10050 [Acidobacteria bacterium]|nr:hypothetical protein [Acidobacteriota bacterium]